MPKKSEGLKKEDSRDYDRQYRSRKTKDSGEVWEQSTADEWINFSEGVPIDVVIEDPEAFEKETPWGAAIVIWVYEFPRDKLVGGIRKLLKLESKRLIKGLKQASPNGVPQSGNGYIIIRTGQGFETTYQVSYNGNFSLLRGGMREPELKEPS